MGSMWPLNPIFEDYTGSIFTVNDLYQANPPFSGYPYPNGARNQPGVARYNTFVPTGSTTPYWVKLRYVRYNPTALVTFTANQLPPVYWKDNTFTVVTPTASEGTMGVNGIAGVLLNTTTTSANLTGNWTLIAVGGYMTNLISAASVAAGDLVFGNASALTVTRLAQSVTAGTGIATRLLYQAATAIASSVSNGIILLES